MSYVNNCMLFVDVMWRGQQLPGMVACGAMQRGIDEMQLQTALCVDILISQISAMMGVLAATVAGRGVAACESDRVDAICKFE